MIESVQRKIEYIQERIETDSWKKYLNERERERERDFGGYLLSLTEQAIKWVDHGAIQNMISQYFNQKSFSLSRSLSHRQRILKAVREREREREGEWTKSIIWLGSEKFNKIKSKSKNKS